MEQFETLIISENLCEFLLNDCQATWLILTDYLPTFFQSNDVVRHLDIATWDEKAAEHYGSIRVYLRTEGNMIGAMDLMIAAHARSQGMILVTNNDKHFKGVPKLKVENWANESE